MNGTLAEERSILGWGKYEFKILWWFFFMWGIVFLDRLVMAFLAPVIMEDIGITDPQYGLINTLTTGCYAVSAIFLTGVLEATGKRKKWFIILCMGAGLFACAGAFTQTFEQLLITRAFVGFCEGPIFAIMIGMMYKESSSKKLAINVGIISVGVAVIALTIGPILTTQIATHASWRMSFLVAGIASVIGSLILIKVLREVPYIPDQRKESVFATFKKLIKVRNIVICFILGISTLCGYWTLMLYATLFFTNEGGRDITGAGLIVGLMGVLAIVWNLVVPKVSDVMGRKPACILWFLLLAIAPFVMFGAPSSITAVIMYALLGGIPGAAIQYIEAIIPGESIPNYMLGTASGLIMGISEITGGSVWPAIAGFIAGKYGYSTVILAAGIAFAIAAVVSFFLKETKGQVVETL